MSDAELIREIDTRAIAVHDDLLHHVLLTPLRAMPIAGGGELLIKCEHEQVTGSFKARGAVAKLLALKPEASATGVVTASTGNHGLGVAYAASRLGVEALVCVPPNAAPVKLAAIERYGATLRTLGADPAATEQGARELAGELGRPYISPYNDLDVITGQATIGLELHEQLGERPLDAVVVAVGGGGLVSGVAATLTARRPGVRVVGASPANDAAMAACVRAGTVVDIDAEPTISDGTAGGIEPGAITVGLCGQLVDEWILVPEAEIYQALRLVIDTQHQLIEGAAATAVAAGLRYARSHPGARIAVVSCGANISADTLTAALSASA